jgi:hypothetical protein
VADPVVLIFHRPAEPDDAALVRLLADVRLRLAEQQAAMLRHLGAEVQLTEADAPSFGELLRSLAPLRGGLVVMGSGAVPRLNGRDARRLLSTAVSGKAVAITDNRYSSDICAIGRAEVLGDLPPLPSDNALPRWLEEKAGVAVSELPGRERLALDIDSPIDVGIWALAPAAPRWARDIATDEGLHVPRGDELRALVANPRRELLVFGRAGSTTLRWLERNVPCRVRFLSEERGLRASSPLAMAGAVGASPGRPPRATLGRLLDDRGPERLADIVAELADGAIIDSRVLMADRYGPHENSWPAAADRFASDLLRPDQVSDPWLRAFTHSATNSRLPIALGAHTMVGPGVPLLLRRAGTD